MSVFKLVMAVLAFIGSFAMGLFMPQKAINDHFMQRGVRIGFKVYLLRFILALLLAALVTFFVCL